MERWFLRKEKQADWLIIGGFPCLKKPDDKDDWEVQSSLSSGKDVNFKILFTNPGSEPSGHQSLHRLKVLETDSVFFGIPWFQMA